MVGEDPLLEKKHLAMEIHVLDLSIQPGEIALEGEKVVDLEEGRIVSGDPAWIIEPLYEALKERQEGKELRLRLLLYGAVPFHTMSAVLYTAGQAGVTGFDVNVQGKQGEDEWIPIEQPVIDPSSTVPVVLLSVQPGGIVGELDELSPDPSDEDRPEEVFRLEGMDMVALQGALEKVRAEHPGVERALIAVEASMSGDDVGNVLAVVKDLYPSVGLMVLPE